MKPNSSALRFIFITLLIDVTGLGLIIPVMPELIKTLTGGTTSDASEWGGWLTLAYAAMQFIFSPVFGNLSDQYGRRPILLLSLLGFGVDYIFLSFAPTIAWLFVGRIVAGITGASFTTASAYIADVSNPENRAQNFGLIGAAFGLGFIVGPLIGGLLGSLGPRVPFLVAAALTLLNTVYGYFVLPESLAPENRRKFDWKRANPLGSLLQLRRYPAVSSLVFSLVLVYIAAHAVQSNWSFYAIERFDWSEGLIGVSLGVFGALIALVQAVLIRKINPALGNEKSVYIGLGMYAVGMLLFGLATASWMLFVFAVPYCLGGIAGPALQAIISGHVPPNEQGELQGGLTSLLSLTSIIGPFVMTHLFAYFTKPSAPVYLPGAPFFLGAVLLITSSILAYINLQGKRAAVVDRVPPYTTEAVEDPK